MPLTKPRTSLRKYCTTKIVSQEANPMSLAISVEYNQLQNRFVAAATVYFLVVDLIGDSAQVQLVAVKACGDIVVEQKLQLRAQRQRRMSRGEDCCDRGYCVV